MEQAERLVEEIRRNIKPLEEAILKHSYLEALEGGRIPKEKLSYFVGEQHRIIQSDLRSIALVVSRCTTEKSRDFFLDVLKGEEAAFGALHILAEALGLTEDWLENYSPSPECQSYTHFLAWLATHGSPSELAGAFLVNLPAWGTNCGRMSKALQERYGLSAREVEFLNLFSTPQPEAEQTTVQIVREGLEQGIQPRQLHLAARLLQTYELLFWDGLYKAAS